MPIICKHLSLIFAQQGAKFVFLYVPYTLKFPMDLFQNLIKYIH